MKRIGLALCVGLLLLLCAARAMALETIDERDSQRGYGACVASMTRRSASRRRNSASTPSAAPTAVALRTDGGDAELGLPGADVCVAGPGNRFTLLFASPEDAAAAVAALREDPHVLYAEEDSEVVACETAIVDDVDFNSYGASAMGFAPLLSWARRSDGQARVAIVDSGVWPHPLLADRLESGWDYVDGDDDPTNDDFGHGTHVAGIVADCTRGAAVTLCAYRVLDGGGRGTTINAANAILDAVDLNIPIINLSFSGTKESAYMDDAVLTALSSGCTVVVAAGNSASDTAGVCPAHLTEAGVIVVGAASADGTRAPFSNYGESVDFYAYGSSVRSCSIDGDYELKSVTSQAAPHISAACALLRIVHGGLSPAALESRLKSALESGIPLTDRLTPQRVEARLSALTLGAGETLTLPTRALPLSCGEAMLWSSSDEGVFTVDEGGALTAVSEGAAVLIGRCANFGELRATVTVSETPPGRLTLPAGLTTLAPEALLGTGAAWVIAPDALTGIGEGAIDPGAVLLCSPDSPAAECAERLGLQYIATE